MHLLTLEWGVPVQELPEPIVIEPRFGQSAWDVAVRTTRQGEPGVGLISGLRATGEAF